MVVGKSEKSDVSYEMTADLRLNGKLFTNQRVYGDTEHPKRRDIFVDEDVRNAYKRLPKTGKARWMGKWYKAKLSFRYSKYGGRIPVYEFNV